VAVGLDLHLDVAHPGHPAIDKQRSVAEDARGITPDPAERRLEVERRGHPPDRASPPARRLA